MVLLVLNRCILTVLLCRYDANVIPMSENDDETEWRAVNLGLGLTIRNMDLDDAGSLTANCWMKATWNDWRLTWDPEDYSPPIKKIVIPGSMIWRPDISVYNQARSLICNNILSFPPKILINGRSRTERVTPTAS